MELVLYIAASLFCRWRFVLEAKIWNKLNLPMRGGGIKQGGDLQVMALDGKKRYWELTVDGRQRVSFESGQTLDWLIVTHLHSFLFSLLHALP